MTQLADGGQDTHLLLGDPDRGRAIFGRLYEVAKIDIHRDRDRNFLWDWDIRARGTLTVIRGHARAGEATVAGTPAYSVLVLVTRGCVDLTRSGSLVQVVPGVTGSLVTAGEDVATFTHQATRTLNLRIEPAALHSHATALLGAPPRGSLLLDPRIDLRKGSGPDLLRLANLVADASAHPGTPLGSPHVLAHLREALYGALLTGHSGALRDRLEKPALPVNTRHVRMAEEILAARASEPVAIGDIAKDIGVSLRSLERSFKATRGYSLRDFLKSQRLDLAHRRLRAAPPGTTVTQVLHASGFGHPGEFSRAYRQRFGEAPSDTLRGAQGPRLSKTR
ncbi:MAG: helix-turn-helix transcriptional regulator [Polyangiaceae bacterium]